MVTKVKTFFHVLTGSIVPQTPYYAKVLKSRILFSFVYFAVLLSITATAIVVVTYFHLNRNNPDRIETCLNTSLSRIPSPYVIHINEGHLATNQGMPLFVWFNCDDKIQLLAVVDERASGRDIKSYGAQLLLTGTELVARYRSYTFTVPYRKYVDNLTLDRSDIIDYSGKLLAVFKYYVPIFFLVLLFLTPLFVYLLNTLYILLTSICVRLFYGLLRKRYTFKKIVQVGFHSSSLPLLSSVLFVIFPVNIWNTLLLYFSLLFVFQLVAVYEAHYVEVPAPHHSPLHK